MRYDFWAEKREAAETAPNGLRFYRYEVHAPGARPFGAMLFRPKATKPTWHLSFKTADAREAYIAQAIASYDEELALKAGYRKERSTGDPSLADPGAVFVNSWGYDQTNVDYYQVVKRSGLIVWIRPIGCESIEGSEGFMCDRVRPAIDHFCDPCATCELFESAAQHNASCGAFTHYYTPAEPLRKRLSFYGGKPTLSFSCGSGSLVDVHRFGNADPLVVKAQYRSWYA